MATKLPITEVLRRAILDSGLPLQRIANETGVQRASLSRFVRGEQSLRLDMADALAAYFGLMLTKTEKPKGVTDGHRVQEADDAPGPGRRRGDGEGRGAGGPVAGAG